MCTTVEKQAKKNRNWYYDCTCGKSKLLKCLVSSSIFISRLLDPIFGSQSGPRTNYDKQRRHFFGRKNTQVVLVLHSLNFLWAVVYKYIVGCRNYYQCFILRVTTILNYLNIANDFVRTVWPKREQRVVDHLPLLTYGIKLSLEAWILESKNSNLNFK